MYAATAATPRNQRARKLHTQFGRLKDPPVCKPIPMPTAASQPDGTRNERTHEPSAETGGAPTDLEEKVTRGISKRSSAPTQANRLKPTPPLVLTPSPDPRLGEPGGRSERRGERPEPNPVCLRGPILRARFLGLYMLYPHMEGSGPEPIPVLRGPRGCERSVWEEENKRKSGISELLLLMWGWWSQQSNMQLLQSCSKAKRVKKEWQLTGKGVLFLHPFEEIPKHYTDSNSAGLPRSRTMPMAKNTCQIRRRSI